MSTTRVQCRMSDHIGRQVRSGSDSRIITDAGELGHLTFGPYEERPAGKYKVAFELDLIDYPTGRLGDFICATLDVVAGNGSIVLARRQVRKAELEARPGAFVLEFDLATARKLEYRVATTGQAKISTSAVVEVSHAPVPSPSYAARRSQNERTWDNEAGYLDGYLRNMTGLIHIGANVGQERLLYEILGLDVLWVEAMSDIYETLLDNIAPYRRQKAICALLADKAGQVFDFNVSSHGAGSSSILDFAQHAEIMPDIQYVERRKIVSTTFATMLAEHQIDLSMYQGLSLDVEGSEYIVLNSMRDFLANFDYIKCEVSDFPSRVGSPTSSDLDDLLGPYGFRQLVKRAFGYGVDGNGTYWDIVWKKAKPGEALFRPNVSLPFIANDESAWEHRMAERLNHNAILPS